MLLPLLVSLAAAAPPVCDLDTPPLEPALYVLTASAGEQPFMFLGHSSLWLRDPGRGLDHVWEFGVIDSRRQEPLSSLLLGTLLCSWEVRPARREKRDYRRQKRTVVADRVALSPAELEQATAALLEIQVRKEEQERFHWRQNSCATKVRDVLDQELGGLLQAQLADPAPASARADVLRHVESVPWAWAGLHLLAGPSSDTAQTRWESAFVPERLHEVLRDTRRSAVGSGAPLLAETCTFQGSSRAPTPSVRTRETVGLWSLGIFLASPLVGLAAAGRRHTVLQRLAGGLVCAIGVVWGTAGTLIAVLWAMSALPVFALNQHLLLASPLSFAWVGLGVAVLRDRVSRVGRVCATGLAGLGLVSAALSASAVAPQDALELTGLLMPPVLAAWAAVAWAPARCPQG